MRNPARQGQADEFSLWSVAIPAFAPATLFGLSEGAMLPVIVLSALHRGADTATAALIAAMIGVASLLTNIPSGMLATRFGERRAMLIAAGITICGLICCLIDLGRGTGSLVLYAAGVFLIGSAGSVYALARQAYLTETVPLHLRARALSTLGGTMRIGLFVGPFLAAGVEAIWGLNAVYCVSLAAILAAGVIVSRAPDLEVSSAKRSAAAEVTTGLVVRRYWPVFVRLGAGVLLLSAIRQTRQSVIPLWAAHIGLSPSTSSLIYGVAGGLEAVTFYPAGRFMDVHGRRAVAVPCAFLLGTSFLLIPLTHGALTLMFVAMLMGLGNGMGSGIVMTLAADTSPEIGRLKFLGVWRELADAGSGLGPLVLSAATAVAGLAAGVLVSGSVGFMAAAALWVWIPHRIHPEDQSPTAARAESSDPSPAPEQTPMKISGRSP